MNSAANTTMHQSDSGFAVLQPGIFSLIEDAGRFGMHGFGLTTGGPLDRNAFRWANRLCANPPNCAAIEITVGGLVLQSNVNTTIAVSGASMPLTINRQPKALWRSHRVIAGDRIELGFATAGTRAYLAVAGGFQIEAIFNSVASVPRESLGGLHRDGSPLRADDLLPCPDQKDKSQSPELRLPQRLQPDYSSNRALLRVIPGYQQALFSDLQKQRFFSSEYRVTESCDRMGYRLSGAAIAPSADGILSEGICLGAIQVPADGQPIVLLNDRQTIGGYPKLGSVLSLDIGKLAQLAPGGTVRFEAISIEQAHNQLLLDQQFFNKTELEIMANSDGLSRSALVKDSREGLS